MSSTNFSSFAYHDSEPDTPIVKKKTTSKAPATKRIVLSSDDEEDEAENNNSSINKTISAIPTVSSSGSSPWLDTRNPVTMSASEKSANVITAITQRKVIRSLIPKKLIPGAVKDHALEYEMELEEEEKRRAEAEALEMKTILSKSNLIRDSLLNKASEADDFDPLRDVRMKTAKAREQRVASRAAEVTGSGKQSNKRRINLDSDDDDDDALEDSEVQFQDLPKIVKKSVDSKASKNEDTIDLTDSPAPNASKKQKKWKVEIEAIDSDDGGWNEEMTKAQLKTRASQIINQCEVVSKTLRRSLQQWEGNRSSSRIAGQNSDCVNLLAIDQNNTVDGNYNTHGHKSVLTDADIAMCCPGLKLNSYQLVGVNWLKLLYENKVNGVLADDMGLGKTVQTISFLGWLSLHHQLARKDGHHNHKHPHLIVVPASTLSNWQNEFKKFCPSLSVYTYHGSQAERTELRYSLKSLIPQGEVDVILSTYTIFEREACKQDRGFIYSQKFNFLVLDEAHCIKNADSSRYANLNSIKTSHRLLLSGTPVQNDLSELLAMLSFLMPSVFGREDCELMMEAFGWQKGGLASNGSSDALSLKQLKSMLAPFVLRRLKRDVLDQLTEKSSKLCLLDMPDMQKDIYEGIITRYTAKKSQLARLAANRDELGNQITSEHSDISPEDVIKSFGGTEAKHLFTALRKAANHPLLLRVHYTDESIVRRIAHKAYEGGYFGEQCTFDRVLQEMEGFSDYDIHQLCLQFGGLEQYSLDAEVLYDSPKMQHLRELLPKLQSEGHRMLLFSQWTRLLDLLEILLNHMEMKFLRLDGSTPIAERQHLIDTYSTDTSIPVFLLSTKAGGLGINLTAADTVILHDLDFNPENDKQAEDRCHRIGQTKPVTIYRLVCKGTVDEDIYEMGERKRELSQAVLSDHRATDPSTPGGTISQKKKGGTQKDDDDLNMIGKILSKALNKQKH